jgi:hypothetical protein
VLGRFSGISTTIMSAGTIRAGISGTFRSVMDNQEWAGFLGISTAFRSARKN